MLNPCLTSYCLVKSEICGDTRITTDTWCIVHLERWDSHFLHFRCFVSPQLLGKYSWLDVSGSHYSKSYHDKFKCHAIFYSALIICITCNILSSHKASHLTHLSEIWRKLHKNDSQLQDESGDYLLGATHKVWDHERKSLLTHYFYPTATMVGAFAA